MRHPCASAGCTEPAYYSLWDSSQSASKAQNFCVAHADQFNDTLERNYPHLEVRGLEIGDQNGPPAKPKAKKGSKKAAKNRPLAKPKAKKGSKKAAQRAAEMARRKRRRWIGVHATAIGSTLLVALIFVLAIATDRSVAQKYQGAVGLFDIGFAMLIDGIIVWIAAALCVWGYEAATRRG